MLTNTNLIDDAEGGSQRQMIEAAGILLGKNTDAAFADTFLNHIRSTGVGMQSASVQAMVNNAKAYSFDDNDTNLRKRIEADFGVDAQESQKVVDGIRTSYGKSKVGLPGAVEAEISRVRTGRKIAPPKNIKYKNVIKGLPNTADIGAEVGLFPLLGLIGNIMATGDVSPEAIQGSVGGIVTAISYANNTGGKQMAFNFGIGTAFKARSGLSQVDPAMGLASIIGQEVAFAIGGSQITGRASNFIANQFLGKPKNILDDDQFQGARNFTSNILGGAVSFMATKMITTFLGNTIAKTRNAYESFAPVVDLISAQIKASATAFNQARTNGVLAETELNLAITNGDADLVATVDDIYYTIENHDVDNLNDQMYDTDFEESILDEEESEFALYI